MSVIVTRQARALDISMSDFVANLKSAHQKVEVQDVLTVVENGRLVMIRSVGNASLSVDQNRTSYNRV
jgi:hypothetical protein